MNYIRIIGGKWRGKRLPIVDVAGLRPSPDRVRETLFNWLSGVIVGANCLDLFCGSGGLGIEALSRGALALTMVDHDKQVIASLKKELNTLKALDTVTIYQAEIPHQLIIPKKPFDIVFLDPPYQGNLWLETIDALENKAFLADITYIYLETNRLIQPDELPTNWTLLKAKKAGLVMYHLAKRESKT